MSVVVIPKHTNCQLYRCQIVVKFVIRLLEFVYICVRVCVCVRVRVLFLWSKKQFLLPQQIGNFLTRSFFFLLVFSDT